MKGLGWLVLIVMLVTSCRRSEQVGVITGEAMGTTYRIKYVGEIDDPGLDELLQQLDVELSTWRDDSWVAAFNRAGVGEAMEMPDSVVELIEISRRIHQQTDGRFDPAIGALIRVWGFGAWKKDWGGEPTPEAVAAARRASGIEHLHIDGRMLSKTRAGLMLDFSGIAKGYAVDRMAARLREAGCRNFVIEFGGDLIACGNAPGKHGWTVDGPSLKEPRQLSDEALATSGSEHHFRKGMSHVIDPASGVPVSVGPPVYAIAGTCAEADALATARLVGVAATSKPH